MTLAAMATFLKHNWLMLILLAGIGGFVGIHILWYIPASDVKSLEDLNARLTDGQPTVVEFYTNL
jgi:hypothetical protein